MWCQRLSLNAPSWWIYCLSSKHKSRTRARAMTWKREQGKQSWSLHRMGPVVKVFIVVLFLERWCKVEGRLSWSYMWMRVLSCPLWLRVYTLWLVRMCVWRLRVWAWKCSNATVTTQPCIIGRGRHTQREENRRKRCVSLCLWVWSLSELGYIMAKCERSPTGSSAVPLSSNSSPLPILISDLFLTPQFLDSIPCCSFLHTCVLSCSGSPSSFVVVSGRNEDSVVILGMTSFTWPISLF